MSVEVTIRFGSPEEADIFLHRFEHRTLFITAAIVGETADLETIEKEDPPSYHDLYITTKDIPRTSIFNLPYGLEVTCNRVGGWCLWDNTKSNHRGPIGKYNPLLVAGEYENQGLRLDVRGHVIVDSLTPRTKENQP